MPQRKPKVGPYDLYCAICFKNRNEVAKFDTAAKLNDHLRNHFVQSLGNVNRIIAIA